MKFLCDSMLGTLAKWLRILGYDTTYGGYSDQELIDIAGKENRILLTRDKLLYQKAQNLFFALYVANVPLDEQLDLTLKKTEAAIHKHKLFSRCTLCNIPIVKKNKREVEKMIPFFVYQSHNTFWKCPNCRRVYWKGSHWENIINRIQNLVEPQKP